MSQLAFGRENKLAALRQVFPLNPNASRLIWQRLNAEDQKQQQQQRQPQPLGAP